MDSALDTRAKEERRFDIACRKLSHFLTEINENKTTQRKRVKDDENMTVRTIEMETKVLDDLLIKHYFLVHSLFRQSYR